MINFDEEYDAYNGRKYYDICVKMSNSTSWKITKPMRAVLDILRANKKRRKTEKGRIIIPIRSEDIRYDE